MKPTQKDLERTGLKVRPPARVPLKGGARLWYPAVSLMTSGAPRYSYLILGRAEICSSAVMPTLVRRRRRTRVVD